jgi:hypothetical protein
MSGAELASGVGSFLFADLEPKHAASATDFFNGIR